MLKRLATLLLAGMVISCAVEAPKEEKARGQETYDDGPNLLSVLRGATIRDRSAEASFEFASMFAVDGHAGSAWCTPPNDLEQWLIAELPVESSIEKVGASLGSYAETPMFLKTARFESSQDGVGWNELGTFDFELKPGNQVFEVEPAEARFVRITMLDNHGSPVTCHVPTLLAWGRELAQWSRPSAEGRWMLNDQKAELREEGHRVYGRVDTDPPMILDGAWDGRVVRFAWARGRTYGVGLLAVSPEGDALSGAWWYENVVEPGNELGSPWFGTRIGSASMFQIPTPAVAQLHVERDGRYPLFGLLFDDAGAFDREASAPAIGFLRHALDSFPQFRVRLEIGEFRSPDSAQNLAMSQAKAASLREGLLAAGLPAQRLIVEGVGSARPYPVRSSSLHRVMYSRADFSFTAIE